jgi:leukotriene-A4 hydrolase
MPFTVSLVLFVQAGDRSLACVVAHEISHSWTGNLVTNRNFEHFWLNEGFTVFVERKILAKLYGEKFRHFAAICGLKDLKETVSTVKCVMSFAL